MELFKNNQDQVLRSSSGNIMTRPYDFGNAFVNESDNYIQVNREFSQYLNLYVWLNMLSGEAPRIRIFDSRTVDNNILAGIVTNQVNGYFLVNKNTFSTTGGTIRVLQRSETLLTGGLSYGVNLMEINLRDTGFNNGRFNLATKINFLETRQNSERIQFFQFGKYNNEYNTACNIGRIMLFDRELSDVEYRYLYNNRLGRDLLSKDGLLLDLHNNRAEILDFSEEQDGSDTRVGVRDFSGNNYHGEIMNLPAGTLEEQLSYANVNLFKSFL